ncbi:MAG: hypothetical protein HY904_06585 [Deltaproteobacteria bacterium]|nr:hypothetical protein [Deltaproteobacteria bacterium]
MARSTQVDPQAVCVPGHTSVHPPSTQPGEAPAGAVQGEASQAPQCSGSVRVSVHTPPHNCWPSGQGGALLEGAEDDAPTADDGAALDGEPLLPLLAVDAGALDGSVAAEPEDARREDAAGTDDDAAAADDAGGPDDDDDAGAAEEVLAGVGNAEEAEPAGALLPAECGLAADVAAAVDGRDDDDTRTPPPSPPPAARQAPPVQPSPPGQSASAPHGRSHRPSTQA